MKSIRIQLPLTPEVARSLRAGDAVLLSGELYTARDAAHKRLAAALDEGRMLPIDLTNQLIYYVGPAPASPGRPVGSAGPTTSYRMDSFAPRLHSLGVRATIGKGKRGETVKQALKDYASVYLGATGGAGALLSVRINAARPIAFEELGPEAIRQLTVTDLPLLVINDSVGGDLYAKPNLAAAGVE